VSPQRAAPDAYSINLATKYQYCLVQEPALSCIYQRFLVSTSAFWETPALFCLGPRHLSHEPPCDLRRPGRVGRWTSDCLIRIRRISLPHRVMCLSSNIFHHNINPVALWYDVFRGKAAISNGLPCVCRVAFLSALEWLSFFMGIVFKECPLGRHIFAPLSFLFSTLGKETPCFGHIKRTSSLSFLFARIEVFGGYIIYI